MNDTPCNHLIGTRCGHAEVDREVTARFCRICPFNTTLPEPQTTLIYLEPVGDKLHEILTECGIRRPSCGECGIWRGRLNSWGVAGCHKHRAEILDRLNSEAAKSSWLEAAGVAARGYFSTAAILDEAIRRASQHSAA